VEISYKSDASIVGKLAMFGDRVMRARAKKVQKELTSNFDRKLRGLV
jgi:carbon monoxide dehydrogenase subunit G